MTNSSLGTTERPGLITEFGRSVRLGLGLVAIAGTLALSLVGAKAIAKGVMSGANYEGIQKSILDNILPNQLDQVSPNDFTRVGIQ